MTNPSFIGYIGEADFHDGTILDVRQTTNSVHVHIRGGGGKIFVVEFKGVHSVQQNNPVGMMLYALSEVRGEYPLRKFMFANWEDDGDAKLEIEALEVAVYPEKDQ
jgi:hypothetical protein